MKKKYSFRKYFCLLCDFKCKRTMNHSVGYFKNVCTLKTRWQERVFITDHKYKNNSKNVN